MRAKLTIPEPSSTAPAVTLSKDETVGPPDAGSAEAEAVALALAEALELELALAFIVALELELALELALWLVAKAADEITSTPTRHNATNNNIFLTHSPFRDARYRRSNLMLRS